MLDTCEIRMANASDYPTLAEIMFDAVRNGTTRYTEQQLLAWVPTVRSGQQWEDRLDAQRIFVASSPAQMIGFLSLAANGYIDFAYVRPSAQGMGVFRRMCKSLEILSLNAGETRLWTHASLMAEPAFRAMGFCTTNEETVEIGDQKLRRFVMEKQIEANIA